MDVWLLKWECVKRYFSFFRQCYRTRDSSDRFSHIPLFHKFYPKIDSSAHFESVFWNIGLFNRKTENTVRFFYYKNKNMYKCYVFTIKTDLRNMSENRVFRRKNRAKQTQKTHFAAIFSKNHCIYRQTKNTNRFFIVKIRIPANFVCSR